MSKVDLACMLVLLLDNMDKYICIPNLYVDH